MRAYGAWCSRESLSYLVWGAADPENNALAVHIHHIREKLHACTGQRELVGSSRRHGYRLAIERMGVDTKPTVVAPARERLPSDPAEPHRPFATHVADT